MSRLTPTYALALLFVLLHCTCAPSPENSGTETADTTEETVPSPTPVAPAYPSIPLERLQFIFDNATYMDATFYDLPISINQNTQAQIQSMIGGIAAQPMASSAGCKPFGHMWFQVDGKNVEECDIFFSEGCLGYVWYDQGKPAFSNSMTQEGLNFYANIIQSVEQRSSQ